MSPSATITTTGPCACGICGAEIRPPLRQCPRCLLELGLSCGKLDVSFTEASEAPLPAPSADFDYELLERVGRGGMGIVYRARQRSLKRIVALKQIAFGEFPSHAALARFRREAETAAKLDHPNIVAIIEVGEHKEKPYLVMRFVEGQSLAERLHEKALPTEAKSAEASRAQNQIARLLATVARAVDYAHNRGVLHRDLKPSNILLDLDGNPHLTDFGIAKSIDQDATLTQTSELLGTPSYMAPEQASGKEVSRASDVYSLGAILYELLTGRPPFEGPKMEVLRKVVESDPQSPRLVNPSIDRDLATICLKCLDKNQTRRYATALELAEDLERWQRREPILAREAGPVIRLQRWAARNPAVATLVASLSIGIMISLTLLARANEEKARKTIALDILRSESARQLQELWNSSNSFVSIKSETLSAMAGMELNTLQPIERRFTIALVSDGNPLDRVLRAAPMLSQLENSMSALVAEPTRFDLQVYKDAPEAINDLVGKKIDFIQLNPREFLRARERDPAVKALIRLIPTTGHNESAVIFTHSNSGIKNLRDLRGRSILLGAADSTLSFWTKASLVTEGVQGTDLAKYRYIDRRADILGDGKSGPAPALGNPYSVMTPVEAVVAGLYDAAVVREKRFQEVAREQGLVALHRFNDSSDLLVAGGSLSADQVGAFCRVILAESETAPGEALLEAPARFRATTEDDFNGLLAHLGAEKAFAR